MSRNFLIEAGAKAEVFATGLEPRTIFDIKFLSSNHKISIRRGTHLTRSILHATD